MEEVIRIKKFTVQGLFNQYNVTLDLTRRCNALIGPNGVGKSTVLKLLYYYLNCDFVKMSEIPFQMIIIEDENLKKEISYFDLFPDSDLVEEYYQNYLRSHHTSQKEIEEKVSALQGTFVNLKNFGLYGSCISNLYGKKQQQQEVYKRFARNGLDYNEFENANIIHLEKLKCGGRAFEGASIVEKSKGFKKVSESFYSDCVTSFEIINSPARWIEEKKLTAEGLKNIRDKEIKKIFSKIRTNHKFDLNALICKMYYSEEFICWINEKADECYQPCVS